MTPVNKLTQSSTFLLGLLGIAAHALWPILFPIELVATLTGAYGLKEHGRYRGTQQ